MKVLVLILVLIGALHLGAIGFFNFDAIMWLANTIYPAVANPETTELVSNPLSSKFVTIAYDVIGVAAILLIICKIVTRKK